MEQRIPAPIKDSDSDTEDESKLPRGLTGLKNLGNTCYLNSALQALSNCPPLTRHFLDCQSCLCLEHSQYSLAYSYIRLITEMWHSKRPGCVVPSAVVFGIKAVHPMFRGYNQQDAQEFMRCFMDQLHEELKYPVIDDEDEDGDGATDMDKGNGAVGPDLLSNRLVSSISAAQRKHPTDTVQGCSVDSCSEGDYETCESGHSSELASLADNSVSGDDDSVDVNERTSCLPHCRRQVSHGADGDGLPHNHASVHRHIKRTRRSVCLPEVADDASGNSKPSERVLSELSAGSDDSDIEAVVSSDLSESTLNSECGEYLDAVCEEDGAASDLSRVITPRSSEEVGSSFNLQPQEQRTSSTGAQCQDTTLDTLRADIAFSIKGRKGCEIRYESIISQIFDGKILSSVQCLYCETVSTTKEAFQDLSLPIPSKEYLQFLHSGNASLSRKAGGVIGTRGSACVEQLLSQNWLTSVFSWLKSLFVGPTVTLYDCLSAFFSADELKGDNMYSCDLCKKLRNGLKYSKVLDLPEILCIHLKRFRHEFYSSKIYTYIAFPLHGLDMQPYLHKDCRSEVTSYDLIAAVCHHGNAGGGHYTSYCLNPTNRQWYEFDDMCVTKVNVMQVMKCEAYVLFYRKSNEQIFGLRNKVMKLKMCGKDSLMHLFVSKYWVNRLNTFAEPGPISNHDFLCEHGAVPPHVLGVIAQIALPVKQSFWELLYNRFGGGPVCNRLFSCRICQQGLHLLRLRMDWEETIFKKLYNEFVSGEVQYSAINALSLRWSRDWEAFIKNKSSNLLLLNPPGPIDNSRIVIYRNGQARLKLSADYMHISPDIYHFLFRIYGGGPEVVIHQPAMYTLNSSAPCSEEQVTGTPATESTRCPVADTPRKDVVPCIQCENSTSCITGRASPAAHMAREPCINPLPENVECDPEPANTHDDEDDAADSSSTSTITQPRLDGADGDLTSENEQGGIHDGGDGVEDGDDDDGYSRERTGPSEQGTCTHF